MPKMTKRLVESIKPNPTKIEKVWDSEIKGFGLIILPSGRKTYCVEYRNENRRKKRLKIGVHGILTTEEARKAAVQLLAKVAQGKDPAREKKIKQHLQTISDLSKEYIERHGVRKKPRSLQEDQKLLNSIILPKLGNRTVKDITRHEVETLHLSLGKTPYHANRMLALLSKMFSLSVAWEWRELNPVNGIERYQEQKRERWLKDDELLRFLEALDQYPKNYTALAIKFLLLTGARKSEALNATWDQIDFKRGFWTKPAHLTKQKKLEHLPLSRETLSLLKTLKKFNKENSPFLFPGRNEGKPLTQIRKFWSKILKESDLVDVRIHDLRHTYASHLVSNGLSLSIVGKLLGHTQASTTQRYAHLADEPLRKATEYFGNKVGKK